MSTCDTNCNMVVARKHVDTSALITMRLRRSLPEGVTVTAGDVEVSIAEYGDESDLTISAIGLGDDDLSVVANFAGGTAYEHVGEFRYETKYVIKVSFTLSSGGAPVVREFMLITYNSVQTED